jgi:hypothetical protein
MLLLFIASLLPLGVMRTMHANMLHRTVRITAIALKRRPS